MKKKSSIVPDFYTFVESKYKSPLDMVLFQAIASLSTTKPFEKMTPDQVYDWVVKTAGETFDVNFEKVS